MCVFAWFKIKVSVLRAAIRARLTSDWRTYHKQFSAWVQAVTAGFAAVWTQVPPDIRSAFPTWSLILIGVALIGLHMLARTWAQPGLQQGRGGASQPGGGV